MLRSAREQYFDNVRRALDRFEQQEREWRARVRREREQFLAQRFGQVNLQPTELPHIAPSTAPRISTEFAE